MIIGKSTAELLPLLNGWRCFGFLAGIALLWLVTGILKARHLLIEADSRKINHVAVFVVGALLFTWLPEERARVNLYVVCAAILLLVVLVCRFQQQWPFCYAYAANTRQSDAPYTTFYFLLSWLVSIIALLLLDLGFGQMALTRMAVLVVGLADGLAEPIGRRWGRHQYRVFSWWGGASFRSVEGSLTVWGVTLAVMLAFSTPTTTGLALWFWAALLTAFTATVIEATSPRGLDNFMLLLVTAGLIKWFLAAQWLGWLR